MSGLNSRFNGEGLSFSDYVAQSREMIAAVRAGTPDLETIVDGNAPFELHPDAGFPAGQHKPYRRGMLLSHGLTDSPYSMRRLAELFRRQGFRVMVLLLPGHGTQPGDLLDVEWQEWARAVAWGAEQLAAEVDELYLGGLSLGAALSLNHSRHDPRVRGLFLFSPALAITPWAALAKLYRLFGGLFPRANWVDVLPDADIYKYESLAMNAVAQTHALIKRLDARPPALPIFAAASRDDMTVSSSATQAFMAQALHPCSKLVLYTTDTAHPPSGIPQEKLELVDSALPAQRILSSAHTAIVLPPDDAHYGAAGDYANCLHYYPREMEKYAACCNAGEAWQGEITKDNLNRGILRRLTYNPHFAELERSIESFIASLP